MDPVKCSLHHLVSVQKGFECTSRPFKFKTHQALLIPTHYSHTIAQSPRLSPHEFHTNIGQPTHLPDSHTLLPHISHTPQSSHTSLTLSVILFLLLHVQGTKPSFSSILKHDFSRSHSSMRTLDRPYLARLLQFHCMHNQS